MASVNVIQFSITGLSPILMNNPASMEGGGPNKKSTTTVVETPEEGAEKRVYALDDGGLYVPAIAFLNSLWEGASYEKIGKYSARSRVQSGIFSMEEKASLIDADTGKPITEYDIDSRYVVIKATGGRIMRHRPKVENWATVVPFEVDIDLIGIDMIIELFNKAGRVTGVMDYRPAKRGPFGRYTCELYESGGIKRGKK